MPKSTHVIERLPGAREAAEARRALDALCRNTPVAIGDASPQAPVIAALVRVLESSVHPREFVPTPRRLDI